MSTMASLPSSCTPGLSHLTSGRSQSQIRNPSHFPQISALGHGFYPSLIQTSQWAHINHRMCSSIIHATRDNSHQPKTPQSPKPRPVWFSWILGWIFSLILPFAHLKGGNLLRFSVPLSQITKVVEEVEEVAETVEEVAEVVEKVSSEVAENVRDNKMLKEAALLVEKVSQEVEKDAKLTMELMHKVDEIKGEVEKEVEMVLKVKHIPGEVAGKASGHRTGA